MKKSTVTPVVFDVVSTVPVGHDSGEAARRSGIIGSSCRSRPGAGVALME